MYGPLQVLAAVCILGCVTSSAGQSLDFAYHNYTRMTDFLRGVAARHPSTTTLYSIGQTIGGRELWVLEVSTVPPGTLGTPEVKLVANIHGNEAVGRELLLHLVEMLTETDNDEYITWLLNNTRVHLLPSLNPDGFEAAREGQCEGLGRFNKNGKDLNRNFPDHFEGNRVPAQPEMLSIKKWIGSRKFVLSGSLHGGAVVASYAYDNIAPGANRGLNAESLSPDDDVFKHLALVYSKTHKSMHKGMPCPRGGAPSFENGIVNGAKWYPLKGGMQDYNYITSGCMEVTLEVSCCKYPKSETLPNFWYDNKMALLHYMGEAQRGVRGVIRATGTGFPVEGALLKVTNRDIGFQSNERGEFWRILLPGDYELVVHKAGYVPKYIPFTVPAPFATRLYFVPAWLDIDLDLMVRRSAAEDVKVEVLAAYNSSAEQQDVFPKFADDLTPFPSENRTEDFYVETSPVAGDVAGSRDEGINLQQGNGGSDLDSVKLALVLVAVLFSLCFNRLS